MGIEESQWERWERSKGAGGPRWEKWTLGGSECTRRWVRWARSALGRWVRWEASALVGECTRPTISDKYITQVEI